MKKLNKTTDLKKYLGSGNLTKPFLDKEFIKEKVFHDYNLKKDKIEDYTPLHSLFYWIHYNTKFGDQEFNSKNRFERNAQEIWESKTTTGCTDYAMLFATFARQLGYPTTILHTAEYNWILSLKNNEDYKHHYGHSFCEVFYEDKWILVDPTCKKILDKYNPDKLVLPYHVGPDRNIYIPYLRDLDLGIRQNTHQHNLSMDEYCNNLEI